MCIWKINRFKPQYHLNAYYEDQYLFMRLSKIWIKIKLEYNNYLLKNII